MVTSRSSVEHADTAPEPDAQQRPGTADSPPSASARDDDPSFSTLTAAFYRGEIERAAVWRGRLDQTTNWAVVFVAAILTWAFTSADHPHYVVLIGIFGVTAFLVMEATRYREYDIWRRRVRVLQQDLFAELYDSEQAATRAAAHGDASHWRRQIAASLREPSFDVSFQQALTHRLRRVYLALLYILLAAWLARIALLQPRIPWRETASILGVSGEVVGLVVGGFYAAVTLLTMWSATGERVREFDD
ncbi:DUF2270 domain-containing protein [Halorarius litoreus]|uniref:DUF2270 domain-containing protein n=1 Tax=Halorarius litoreus TaxID=2962676 RepID=UPI0020CB9FBC|nr:DUF2270 domain-containing protein [Halorarius litoreus]